MIGSIFDPGQESLAVYFTLLSFEDSFIYSDGLPRDLARTFFRLTVNLLIVPGQKTNARSYPSPLVRIVFLTLPARPCSRVQP